MVFHTGNVVGSDKASLAQIDQLVSKDASQLQALRGTPRSSQQAGALQHANIDVNNVIAVDLLPSGGLEVFTT